MSTSNGKLGEDFLRIPKLAADGENWMMYKERLQWSIDARGLIGHLDGTEKKPVDPQTLPNRGASWAPATPDEVKEVSTYKTELKEWRTGQAITKQQIAGTIPDSLFIQIKNLDTAKDIFTHLSSLFEQRSRVVSVELLRKRQDLKCPEKGNVREHFDKMRTAKEQLSSLGHAPTDESFAAMIMSSLPASYDPHLSALTASAKVSSVKLTADVLMSTIVDEYDRRASKSKKAGSSSDDAAYNANAGQHMRKIKHQFQ
jgi:gag-polypeptide of LTR copia-type